MYKLCDLHLSVENYTEAAFTLLRRADDLQVRAGENHILERERTLTSESLNPLSNKDRRLEVRPVDDDQRAEHRVL